MTVYQIGDLIVYGGNGVCRVEAVGPDKGGRLWYTLLPLYQDCKIIAPVDNPKVPTRPALSRRQAEALIDQIPTIQATAYHSKALRELTEYYQAKLKTYDCRILLELTMSIYAKKQTARNGRVGAVDESYLRRAEDLLFTELAAALELDRDQVQPYIAQRMAEKVTS